MKIDERLVEIMKFNDNLVSEIRIIALMIIDVLFSFKKEKNDVGNS